MKGLLMNGLMVPQKKSALGMGKEQIVKSCNCVLFFKSHLNYSLSDQKWVEGWRLSNVINKTTPFIKFFIVRVTWWQSRP